MPAGKQSRPSGIMAFRSRLSLLAAALTLSLVMTFARPLEAFDRVFSDFILVGQSHPADDDIVVVTISGEEVAKAGVIRLDRLELARVLERLADAGVERILLDIAISGWGSETELDALRSAFRKLGPDRIGFPVDPAEKNAAAPGFDGLVTKVDSSLIPDPDGRFRSISGPRLPGTVNPAAWLGGGRQVTGATAIDRRIDPFDFRQIAYSDVADSRIPIPDLSGRLVVIARDHSLIQSRTVLPVHGIVDRGLLLSMGAQSWRDSFARTAELGRAAEWLLLGLALGCGLAIGSFAPGFRSVILLALGFMAAAIFINLTMARAIGAAASPFLQISVFMLSFQIAIARRLRLAKIVAGFLKGDLSPEEAWLWQSHSEAERPAILLAANGGIKRANAAAISALRIAGDAAATRRFAEACFPEFGRRGERFADDRAGRIFAIDWPHPVLPLTVLQDVTSIVEKETALSQRLITDQLTGVRNRLGFDEALAALEADAVGDYAVFFMDMNGFKAVNDTYGHDAGDQLLRVAAARFGSALRKPDMLARLGGDEFAVIIPSGINHGVAGALAEKLERQLDLPVRLDKALVKVGVAVGYALPDFPGEPAAAVLSRADKAMYLRKAAIKAAA
jgi:diguanylate cyclase (GGDEF)-like protein